MNTVATNTSPKPQGRRRTQTPSPKPQRRRDQTPASGYILTTPSGHQLLVRRPDGRPMRVRPSGLLMSAGGVKSGQSYLHVPAA